LEINIDSPAVDQPLIHNDKELSLGHTLELAMGKRADEQPATPENDYSV